MKPPPEETSKDDKPSGTQSTFRLGSLLILLGGVGVTTALVAYHNFSSVIEAAHRIGWGFALVLLIQVSGIALNGLAWRALFRSEKSGFTNTLFILRWIRESINYLLPVGRLGGDMVAVRLLAARRRDVNTAAASVVADKTLEVLGLFLFAVAGFVILFESGVNSNSARYWAIRALGATFAVLVAFLAAQRWGLLNLVDRVVKKFSGMWGGGGEGSNNISIHETVWGIYGDVPRLILAAFLHAVAWVPGALQIWVAMRYMGLETRFLDAFVIESLTMIICSAAFVMPASLGVQEASYMTVGWWLFGIPPAAGLALSLVQRMKDVLFGVPGLLVWQGLEGKHLWSLWRRRKK
ncbi:flippase-like domain-containing protein [Geobacter hydrogenophilus]|uniref:lysylphosphatidylglycerol synthase domain-containing protein n=1 Tax=Geobacter hydrogenophilus TaxID=40983 RepID=UPI001FEC0285|nr:lysylphosphatidylglycerol synthase domain-containing protein [Geobacter hydrogenophilus]MBT0895062.1 flippase-like domain-containing protein [Geobacter hydrogenophilus]